MTNRPSDTAIVRPRTRASAKAAGASFERLIADHLAERVDDRIDRRVKTGAADRGDIAGVRLGGMRVVIECKNERHVALGSWYGEASRERVNDDAVLGLVIHKRHGHGYAGHQWVTMTVDDLIVLLDAGSEA